MGWIERAVVFGLPAVPRAVVERVARQYVAGETLTEAIATLRSLNDEGVLGTVDVLGEDVSDASQVEFIVEEYLRLLDGFEAEACRSNVSLKLTALGLKRDPELCRESLRRIATKAGESRRLVRIDMEDHTCTDATLALYREVQPTVGSLGLVLQARLRRTPADIEALLTQGARANALNVRLCKGIYLEPAAIAHQNESSIREAFTSCLRRLLESGCYVGIATHDDVLVDAAECLVDELKLHSMRYEFQLLLGVRPVLRRRLLAAGHQVRVYVPYGRDWYAYSLRRLRENPGMARHIMRAALRRG